MLRWLRRFITSKECIAGRVPLVLALFIQYRRGAIGKSDMGRKKGEVEYDESKINDDAIIKVIEEARFKATVIS